MKKLTLPLLAAFLVFTSSDCGNRDDDDGPAPDEVGEVNLKFRGEYDASPLVMYANEYAYEDGMDVKFQLFMFYISSLTALKANGEEILLSEVELVSFENVQSLEDVQKGIEFTFDELPAGGYSGIRFGIGVAPFLNMQAPAAYAPPHPLASNTHHWSAAGSYVFTKIEGNADTNGDGGFTEKLTYHIGSDAIYREKTFTKDFTISENTPANVNIVVDLKKMMARSEEDFLDFRTFPADHHQKPEVYDYLYTNLVDHALQVK